jgi:hypothetical protein
MTISEMILGWAVMASITILMVGLFAPHLLVGVVL